MLRILAIPLAAISWVGPVLGQTEGEKKATVSFLRGLQTSEGGFLATPANRLNDKKEIPSLRATSAALRALKNFGGEVPDKKSCAQFVQDCFDKESGGFRDHPKSASPPDVATTAVGMMAVMELKLLKDDFAPKVKKYLEEHAKSFEEIRIAAAAFESIGKVSAKAQTWLDTVAKIENPDGTFGKGDGQARETASFAVTWMRLRREPLRDKADLVKALQLGQRQDGGYGKQDAGSDLESSYRVMRAFMMFREKPGDVEQMKKFISRCRNNDAGYGVSPGQPSTAAGTYFASTILHWLAEK